MSEFLQSPAIPVLTFLLGLIVGHRLAVGRDRRKEFNDAAAAVRAVLVKSRANLNPMAAYPSAAAVDLLEQTMRPSQRKGWRKAYSAYQLARMESIRQDELGQPFYVDVTAITRLLEECLSFCGRR